MEEWNKACSEYRRTLEFVSGCGARGQCYIDSAYAKLEKAHTALSAEERTNVGGLPRKPKCGNDGTSGVSSGFGIGMSSLYK